jgi:hypothetical protein
MQRFFIQLFKLVVFKILPRMWHYSGLAYIAAKASSSENKEHHPTLPIWLLGLYLGLFGMATQYYETHLNRFESILNIYVSQLGTSARTNTFLGLVLHQGYELPLEPDFRDPWRTIKTLIFKAEAINQDQSHAKKIRRISDIISRFKSVLGCEYQPEELGFESCIVANLTTANLSRSDLFQANLRKTILLSVNLTKANLGQADMSMANLMMADLSRADLHEANLYNANLAKATMKGTDITNANLKGANLLGVKHLSCEQLKTAKFWQSTYRDESLACGASTLKAK